MIWLNSLSFVRSNKVYGLSLSQEVCGSLARHTARHTARYTARHTARYTARDHSVRTFSLPACLVPPLVPGRRKTTEISSTVQMNSTYAKRK